METEFSCFVKTSFLKEEIIISSFDWVHFNPSFSFCPLKLDTEKSTVARENLEPILKFIVLLVKSKASKTSTNTKGVIFIKAELNDVSSVASGGLLQVKAEHNAHRI